MIIIGTTICVAVIVVCILVIAIGSAEPFPETYPEECFDCNKGNCSNCKYRGE